jgi:hypothetical protein
VVSFDFNSDFSFCASWESLGNYLMMKHEVTTNSRAFCYTLNGQWETFFDSIYDCTQ